MEKIVIFYFLMGLFLTGIMFGIEMEKLKKESSLFIIVYIISNILFSPVVFVYQYVKEFF